MPDETLDFSGATPLTPKKRSTYDENRPANSGWSLDRIPDVQNWYSSTYKKQLPLVNKGQGGIHNKLGYDHRNSADVSIRPDTPEGQAFSKYLKENNIPFLAFDRAVKGVATGAHYHLGEPSHKTATKYPIGSQVRAQRGGLNFSGAESDEVKTTAPDEPQLDFSGTVATAKVKHPSITSALDKLTADVNARTAKIKPAPRQSVGMGDVQEASRTRTPSIGDLRQMDNPEIGFDRRGGQPSRVTQTSDELRVMKGEQPRDRQGYSRQQDVQVRLSKMRDESYREQQAREAKDAQWRAANQPAIDKQAEIYRKDIQKAKAAGGDATKWLTEFATQAGGQLLETLPGTSAQIYSEAALKAAEAEGADRSQLSKGIQSIGAGLIGSVPELAAMSAGLPAPAVFAAGSAVRSKSSDPVAVAEAAGHGALTGEAFELGGSNALKRIGATGLASTGIELASGASPKDALIAGATNAAMRGVGEIGHHSELQNRRARNTATGTKGQFKSGKIERVTEATVPETPETLTAQVDALRNGTRDAVLLTPGTKRPALPPRTSTVKTDVGLWYYNPAKTDANTIKAKVADGSHGDLIGHVAPKPEVGEPTAVVTATNLEGVEVQSSAVSPEKVSEQVAATQVQNPEAKITVGDESLASQIIEKRLDPPSPARNPELTPREVSATESPVDPPLAEVAPSTASQSQSESSPLTRTLRRKPEQIVDDFRKDMEDVSSGEIRELEREMPRETRPASDSVLIGALDPYGAETHQVAKAILQTPKWKERVLAELGEGAEPLENAGGAPTWRTKNGDIVKVSNAYGSEKEPTIGTRHDGIIIEREKGQPSPQAVKPTSLEAAKSAAAAAHRKAVLRIGDATTEMSKSRDKGKMDALWKEIKELEKFDTEHSNHPLLVALREANNKVAEIDSAQSVKPTSTEQATPKSPVVSETAVGNAARIEQAKTDLAELSVRKETPNALTPKPPASEDVAGLGSKAQEPTQPKIVSSEGQGGEKPPEPSKSWESTSVKNAATDELRADLDLLEIERPEKKAFQTSIDNAIAKGLDKNAEKIADEVIAGKREVGLDNEQAAGVLIKMRELENQWEERYRKDSKDPELVTLKARLDKLSQAADMGGTAPARDLAFRRSMVDKEFRLINLIKTAEKAKGRAVTAEETTRYDSIVKERDAAIRDRDIALEQLHTKRLQWDLDKSSRQRKRSETKEVLDSEASTIRADIAAEIARLKAQVSKGQFLSQGGLGSLDPDGVIAKGVLKYVRNRAKVGGLKAKELIDEVHSMLGDLGASRRQVAELLAGGTKREAQRAEWVKELARVRSEIKSIIDESGPPELKRAKTVARKRIAELNEWIAAGKRVVKDKSELIPDSELTELRTERDALKEAFDVLEKDSGEAAIRKAVGAVERSIKANEERLTSGNLDPARKTVSPWSKELGERQQVDEGLRKQLGDARKAAEVKADPEDVRINTALKAKQKAIELEQENLRTGQATNKGTKSSPWSPELGKLNQELLTLRRQRTARDKTASQPARDAARAESALGARLKAAERAVAETQAKVDNADTAARRGAPQPTTPQIESIRAQNKLLNSILADMRVSERKATREAQIASGEMTAKRQGPQLSEAPKQGPRLSEAPRQGPPNVIKRNAARLKYLEAREAEFVRKTEAREFDPKAKPEPFPYDRAVRAAEDKVSIAEAKFKKEMNRAKGGHQLRNASGVLKAWLLSGPSTQLKNTLGTASWQGFEEQSRVFASAMDAAISGGRKALGGQAQRGIMGVSPSAVIDSLKHMATVGGRQAIDILKHGATKEQMERHQYQEIDFGVNTKSKGVNDAVKAIELAHNAIFRFMSTSDRLFYQYAHQRNLIDRATVAAKNEGLKGKELESRIKELKTDERIDADAKYDALVSTFNNDNALSTRIKRARSKVVNPRSRLSPKAADRVNAAENLALDLVLPFDRTPTNVVSRIVEASPLGYTKNIGQLVKAAMNKGMDAEAQRNFSRTFGRASAGTVNMALGAYLLGKMIDVDDKGDAYLNLGFTKINLNALSPLGNLMALGARLKKAYDDPNSSAGDYAKPILREPANLPILRATNSLSELGRDPERSASKTASRFAGMAVPFSGLLRDLAKSTDSEDYRYPQGFTENLKSGIPGLRESLDISPSPIFAGQSQSSLASKETQRLGINIKGAVKQDDESPEDFASRKALENGMIRTQLENVVALPDYEKASDEDKKEWLKQAATYARGQAKDQLPEKAEKPEKREFPMPSGFDRAFPDQALKRYEKLSPAKRAAVYNTMAEKAWLLLNSPTLSDEEKAKYKERLDAVGVTPRAPNTPVPSLGSTYKAGVQR